MYKYVLIFSIWNKNAHLIFIPIPLRQRMYIVYMCVCMCVKYWLLTKPHSRLQDLHPQLLWVLGLLSCQASPRIPVRWQEPPAQEYAPFPDSPARDWPTHQCKGERPFILMGDHSEGHSQLQSLPWGHLLPLSKLHHSLPSLSALSPFFSLTGVKQESSFQLSSCTQMSILESFPRKPDLYFH